MSTNHDKLGRMADEELMDLVAATDADAFSVFYDRHITAAYSLAYRIAGSQSLADDVTQAAFLSVWRSAQRYDSRQGSVRSWILSITHNRAIDQLRRATRHSDRRAGGDIEAAERLPARDAPANGHRAPAQALFSVDAQGAASVVLPEGTGAADAVLATSEPARGSVLPSREPIVEVPT